MIDERKPHPNSRKSTIELLDIGDSYSVARRLDLTFGLSDAERIKHTEQVRVSVESMAARARRKNPGRKFVVESFIGHPSSKAVIFVSAVVTRLA